MREIIREERDEKRIVEEGRRDREEFGDIYESHTHPWTTTEWMRGNV